MPSKKVEVNIYHHKANDSRHPNESRNEKTKTCPRCHGTGKVHNPNSIFDITCPTCDGKGWNPVP